MDIITKAKELGELIAASPEMAALKRAEAEVMQDEKAGKLFNVNKKLQVEISKALRDGEGTTNAAKKQDLLKMNTEEIETYPITKSYLEAKKAFDILMKTINDVMIFAITGEENCSPDKCSSCGGCR